MSLIQTASIGRRGRGTGALIFASAAIGFGPGPWGINTFTLTQNFAAGPSGAVNATRIQTPVGGGYVRLEQAGLAPGRNYRASWWIKNNGGAGTPLYKVNGGPGDSPGFVAIQNYAAFDATWRRFFVTVQTIAAGSGSTGIFWYLAGDQTVAAGDFLVADMLVEAL